MQKLALLLALGVIVIVVLATGIRGCAVDPDGAAQTSAATAPPTRRVIQPPGYKPTPSPLTPGILIGDTLYLSGSTGGDPATGQLVKGGFEAEMRQIMSNMQTVLKEAGMTLADVVSVTGYLADMKRQFAGHDNHLCMVDEVLGTLLHQQRQEIIAEPERGSDPRL